MKTSDTQKLLDLIGRKHDCLAQLHRLGGEQQGLVDTGDVGRLLSLLAIKQQTLQALSDVERELDPYRREDPRQRVWASEAERMHCAALAERSERMLREILEIEKRCEESLQRRRDETAEQLSVVQAAGAARGAYLNSGSLPVSTIDLQSGT